MNHVNFNNRNQSSNNGSNRPHVHVHNEVMKEARNKDIRSENQDSRHYNPLLANLEDLSGLYESLPKEFQTFVIPLEFYVNKKKQSMDLRRLSLYNQAVFEVAKAQQSKITTKKELSQTTQFQKYVSELENDQNQIDDILDSLIQAFLILTDSQFQILRQKTQTLMVIQNQDFNLEIFDNLHIHHIVPNHVIAEFLKKEGLSVSEREALKRFQNSTLNLLSVTREEHKFLHEVRYTEYKKLEDGLAVLILDGKFEELRNLAACKDDKQIQESLNAAREERLSSKYPREINARSQLKTDLSEIHRQNGVEGNKFGKRYSGELNTPERRKPRQVIGKANSYAGQSNRIVTKYDRIVVFYNGTFIKTITNCQTGAEVIKELETIAPSLNAQVPRRVSEQLRDALERSKTFENIPKRKQAYGWSFDLENLPLAIQKKADEIREKAQKPSRASLPAFVQSSDKIHLYYDDQFVKEITGCQSPGDVLMYIKELVSNHPETYVQAPKSARIIIQDAYNRQNGIITPNEKNKNFWQRRAKWSCEIL